MFKRRLGLYLFKSKNQGQRVTQTELDLTAELARINFINQHAGNTERYKFTRTNDRFDIHNDNAQSEVVLSLSLDEIILS